MAWDDLLLQELLKELRAAFSDFNSQKSKITEDVYLYAKDAVRKSKGPGAYPSSGKPPEKYEEVKRNIKRLIQLLKECRKIKDKFMAEFPEWKRVRLENVKALNDIGEKINSDRFNCNVSKLVGSSVSATGGAVSLVSAALIPFTFGLTAPLAVAGLVTTTVGAATSFGASVAEMTLLNEDVGRAQEICSRDQQKFQPVQKWVEQSQEIMKAMHEIIDIDLLQKLLQNIKNAGDILTLGLTGKVKNMVSSLVSELLHSTASGMVAFIPFIISLVLIATISLPQSNLFLVDCAAMTFCIVSGILSSLDIGTDITRAMVSFLRGGKDIARPVGQALARGAFAVVGIGFDIANIALTSIDVHNGSVSEQAQQIFDASKKMKEELEMLNDVYTKLREIKEN